MAYLGQNGIVIILVIAAMFLMMRMGGCGMGHRHRSSAGSGTHDPKNPQTWPANGQNDLAVDPVSGQAVSTSQAPASAIHGGRVFVFENRVNRDLFEANPEQYASKAGGVGVLVASRDGQGRKHGHRGC
jgi:YHS domain-containing protein